MRLARLLYDALTAAVVWLAWWAATGMACIAYGVFLLLGAGPAFIVIGMMCLGIAWMIRIGITRNG